MGLCAVFEFETLTEQQLDAAVHCVVGAGGSVREIEGGIFHQLEVRPQDHAWRARVIFDA